MNTGLIIYLVVMVGIDLILLKVARQESARIARIMADKGETETSAKAVSEAQVTTDTQYMGRSNIYTYTVSGKSYTYETKLTLPFSFGAPIIKIWYEKSHPENAVTDSWIEIHGIELFTKIWITLSIICGIVFIMFLPRT